MKRLLLLSFLIITGFSFGQTNNYSLEFDGNNFNANDGRVEFGNVNLGNNFTICFWVKDSTHLNSYFHELVNINGDFTTGLYSDTLFGVNIGSGGNNNNWALSGNGTVSYPTSISNFNSWTHMSISYDNDSLKVYVNAQKVSQYSVPGYNLNGYLLLGDRNFNSSGNYNHNGKMDDVSLWNVVLTEQEIQDYMNCPPTGTETGLVGYWNFEEGTGTTTTDQTTNGNNGTLNVGVTWSSDVPPYNCCSSQLISSSQNNICSGEEVNLSVDIDTNSVIGDTIFIESFTMDFNNAFNYTTSITNVGTEYMLKVSGGPWGGANGDSRDATYWLPNSYNNNTLTPETRWGWNRYGGICQGVSPHRPDPDVYNPNGDYYFYFTGNGGVEEFCFADGAYGDNFGSLFFELYEITSSVSPEAVLWSTGETDPSIVVSPTTSQWFFADVTTSSGTCSDSVEIIVNTIDNGINQLNDVTLQANLNNAQYQWIDCNGNQIINGEVSQNFTATYNGDFAVIVSDNGCSDTTDCVTISKVGLNELNQQISIYPNPTSTSFTITSKNSINSSFKLMDIQGKVVLTGKIESTEETVDISKLSKGQYNLVFEDESISPISIIKN